MFGKMKKKIVTSGAPCVWCTISVFHTNGASPAGAPLVYSSGALLTWCVISINPIYSSFPSSVTVDSDDSIGPGHFKLHIPVMGYDLEACECVPPQQGVILVVKGCHMEE